MEYTEQQKQEFKNQFAVKRGRQIAMFVSFIVLIIILTMMGDSSVFFPGLIVIIIGAYVFSLKNWRCPACNKLLGKGFFPRFCRKCGVELR